MTPKLKHWRRVVRRADRIIAELEQLIRDMNHWNGLPHNQKHTPLDVEPDRLLLAQVRRKKAEFIAQNPRPEA